MEVNENLIIKKNYIFFLENKFQKRKISFFFIIFFLVIVITTSLFIGKKIILLNKVHTESNSAQNKYRVLSQHIEPKLNKKKISFYRLNWLRFNNKL